MAQTPQRFSGRAGSNAAGRVRRALDAHIDTDRRVNESLTVDSDGRLGTKLARNSGLTMTRDGLTVDPLVVGDKNRPAMNQIQAVDLSGLSTANSLTALESKVNELLRELKRTGRTR